MNEKLKKYLELFPILVPVIYILGFIVVNGYLSNFGFADQNILSFAYLKAGISVSLIITIIFLATIFSYSKETMTDDLRKSWPSLLLTIYNAIFLSLIFSLVIVDIKDIIVNHKTVFYILFSCVIFYMFFRTWSMNKKAKNNKGILFLIIPGLILCLAPLIILSFYYRVISIYLIINLALALGFTISIGDFGDKNYNARIISDIILIVGVSFFFGKYIYGEIPTKFGGAKNYSIIIHNAPTVSKLTSSTQEIDTVSMLYENNDRILIRDKMKNVLFIDKSEIKIFKLLPQ